MTVDHSDEIRLRATIRDRLALSMIPEQWVGREPSAIVADLADLLIGSLEVDFAFVRLCDPGGSQVVEVRRGDSWKNFPEWLQRNLAESGQISRKEVVANIGGVEKPYSGFLIPIGVNCERGLVAVASDRSGFPDPMDQQLLSVAANNAATAFQNAFLINELRDAEEALREREQELRAARDALEIKVAERTAELQRREAYLAEAQGLSHTGSFGWNVSTDEIFWSDETFRIFEFDPSSKVSLPMILDRVHPEDIPSANVAIAPANRAEGIDLEFRLVMPDRRIKYLHAVGKPRTGDTRGIEIIGAVMDITARKLIEIDLRRSKDYLADAQKLSRTGCVGMERNTKRIFWSDEAARIYGYPPGTEPTPELILQRSHPDDAYLLKEVLERAAQDGNDFDLEHRLVMPDGSIKHLHDLAHRFKDQAGNEEIVGAIMDVTERKVAEEVIRRSEAYLAEAQRLSHAGSFAWSPTRDTTYFSEECYRVLGFEPDGHPPPFEAIVQRIHPDDQARCRELVEKALRDKADLEIDYRIFHPNKTVRNIHCLAHAVLAGC